MKNLFWMILCCAFLASACGEVENEVSEENNEVVIDSLQIDFDPPFWEMNEIDSAVLYVYYSDSATFQTFNKWDQRIVGKTGELNPYVFDEFTHVLVQEEISQLNKLIIQKVDNLEQGSSCYRPHHGFIMWNSQNEMIGHLSICLDCENYDAEPDTKNEIDLSQMTDFIKTFNVPANGKEIDDYMETGRWN